MDWFWRDRRRLDAHALRMAAEFRKDVDALKPKLIAVTDPDELRQIAKDFDDKLSLTRAFEQSPLRDRGRALGITVPDTYRSEGPFHDILLKEEGGLWLRREIRKARVADVKQVLDLVTPLLASLISIGSLLVAWAALHKK